MGQIHKIKISRKMVILNVYPVKAKLKDGYGTPIYLFRIPPKTSFRFETISPGITFAGVTNQAGADALALSLAAARPQSSVTWNGPDADMDVRVAMIQNVNGGGGGDSTKVYLQKPGGVWDDRYATSTGQWTMLAPGIFDYDYYIQCDYPHFPLMISVVQPAAGYTSSAPYFHNSAVGVAIMGFPNNQLWPPLYFLGTTSQFSSHGIMPLQEFENISARHRYPPGVNKISVHPTGFGAGMQTNIFSGNVLVVVAEIHDDGFGSNGEKCC